MDGSVKFAIIIAVILLSGVLIQVSSILKILIDIQSKLSNDRYRKLRNFIEAHKEGGDEDENDA